MRLATDGRPIASDVVCGNEQIVHWLVPTSPIDPGAVVSPAHLAAVAADWIEPRGAPQSAPLSHDSARKRWALGGLEMIDGVTAVRIVTFSTATSERMMTVALQGKSFRVGHQHGVVIGDPVACEVVTAAEILRPDLVARSHGVTFLTPTSLRRGSRSSPLLEPRRVAVSLSRRWTQFSSAELPDIRDPRSMDLTVTDIDGRNEVFKIGGGRKIPGDSVCENKKEHSVSGFLGRMRFEYHTQESALLFSALWNFGLSAGVGAYTTNGFGRIAVNSGW